MRYAALSLLAVLLMGCASERKSTPNAEGPDGVFARATPTVLAKLDYHVDPPDEITVRAPNIKELDNQKQKIRPDGKITLNMLGEIYVAGMTPTQINALLTKLASKYYTDPDIKVEVTANSKFYYVFGFGVSRQGRYSYTGRDTVVTALAEAGFNDNAWPEQIRVSRPAKADDGKPATAVVDFKKFYEYGDMKQNYLLQPGDIIEIPYSPLAAWDVNTRRLLGPLTGTMGFAAGTVSMVRPGMAGGYGGGYGGGF